MNFSYCVVFCHLLLVYSICRLHHVVVMFHVSLQILGVPLSHPDDLSSFDYELHKNAVTWVQENSVNDLDLSFSVDALNPWNSKPVTIDLTDDSDKKLTDDNKVRDHRSPDLGSGMTNLGKDTGESILTLPSPLPLKP